MKEGGNIVIISARQKRLSFTLVAIIGLLAAIAIPSFVKARNTAQQNACINNLRIIDAGKEQWAFVARQVDGAPDNDASVNEYIIRLESPKMLKALNAPNTYTI